ncbi:MAG TPA: hypothetical protein VMS56_13825 [Thermoanaerobaculia bacterium]|nr:hypothetical protein [Thermoanaerobaculia bacterium]
MRIRPELVLLACAVVALPLSAAGPLFPRPLHLTREIVDPISGRTSTIDEYFHGDRAVAVHGEVVAIADYARGELLRIDRAAGTWSVAGFDALARAAAGLAPATGRRGAGSAVIDLRRAGDSILDGRRVELWRGVAGEDLSIEVAVDRSIGISRDALEVVAGSAFPAVPSAEQRAILAAAAPAAARDGVESFATQLYALPLETKTTFRIGGESLTAISRVTRVGDELPPAGLLDVPPGSRRIESDLLEAARRLDALDHLPADPPPEE